MKHSGFMLSDVESQSIYNVLTPVLGTSTVSEKKNYTKSPPKVQSSCSKCSLPLLCVPLLLIFYFDFYLNTNANIYIIIYLLFHPMCSMVWFLCMKWNALWNDQKNLKVSSSCLSSIMPRELPKQGISVFCEPTGFKTWCCLSAW